MRLARAMLESGLYGEQQVEVMGIKSTPFEIMYNLLLELPETKQTPVWAYGLVVDVMGVKDGQDARIRFWSEHPPQEEWGGQAAYYKNIAVPLSIGAVMIAQGEVPVRGVVPPETAYDPGRFFDELARRGIVIKQEVEML
jgi:saccharopine dehydrogenase-like NADP-dependent oxidoreductase